MLSLLKGATWKFENHCSKWYWKSLAGWSCNQGGEQLGNSSPKLSKTCSVVSSVEYISWVRPFLLSEIKSGFVFSLKTMAIQYFFLYRSLQHLLEKKWPALKIWIVHYVNCNTNIPGLLPTKRFCDYYRNMGHFLCSVERIKRFVNVHLHGIVSNVPSKGSEYSGPPHNCCAVKSFSRTCNIPMQWKLHRKQGAIWMKCVFCSYFDKIVYLIYNSQSL